MAARIAAGSSCGMVVADAEVAREVASNTIPHARAAVRRNPLEWRDFMTESLLQQINRDIRDTPGPRPEITPLSIQAS
jgi:hypothetical protein